MAAKRKSPRPWPKAPSAPAIPTAQPRAAAGSSSAITTKAVAAQVTMKVRPIICSATNCSTLWAKAEPKVARLTPTIEARNRRRRPTRSARGTSRKAGTAPRWTNPSAPPRSDSRSAKLSEICLSAAVRTAWS